MIGLMERFFARLGIENSLTKRLRGSLTIIVCLLILPAVISIGMMARYAGSYHAVITRIEAISELKPVVLEAIPDELFSIVAGRSTFGEGKVRASIDAVNARLDALSGSRGINTEMLVARRTMNTLTGYVSNMEALIEKQAPVAESEVLLEEVRSVATLVGAMLDESIDNEITLAGETSAQMQTLLRNVAFAECALLLVCILFAVLAQRSLLSSIREPIARLETLAVHLATGDLAARTQQTETVELVKLTNSLNLMGDKLQTLINENRREQENLKKSELRTLQAQIAPHFLYNTLDAIVWLAEEKRSDEVIRITKALSDFFRISLSQGHDWISVKQERKHIEGYLTIQQIRYRDILNYSIEIPEELDDLVLLKLVLQPLVENAIYHGVKHRRGRGMIRVIGTREHDTLCFAVQDDGAGMSAEKLRAVRDSLRSDLRPEREDAGYGLYNVNKRIQLYYNQPEGLFISSDQSGTTVSFRVPARSLDAGARPTDGEDGLPDV